MSRNELQCMFLHINIFVVTLKTIAYQIFVLHIYYSSWINVAHTYYQYS